jgi:hypothetical protein
LPALPRTIESGGVQQKQRARDGVAAAGLRREEEFFMAILVYGSNSPAFVPIVAEAGAATSQYREGGLF